MATITRPRKPNQRRIRVPSFNYHLKQRPWQIQPFFIAPVLPGDSVKNFLWKQTSVSDPVANRLIGWWQETHLFYVRVRDCFPGSADLVKSIFVDPNANLSSIYGAASVDYFHRYGVNWCKEATRLIVENYFRSDDEAPDDALIDNLWAATVGTDNWLDSVQLAATRDVVADVPFDIGTDHIFTMHELEEKEKFYRLLQAGQLTDMTYEDYLATAGVHIPTAELPGKPIHLRSIRNWTMPTNTVEPSTGVATTAMYWQLDGRHDKDFFVREPGFLIGLQVFRPKVYMSAVRGSLTAIMDTAMEWLPPIMQREQAGGEAPYNSIVQLADTTGPLVGIGQDYIVDVKDLLMYGEQFTNLDLSTVTGINSIALPAALTAPTPDVIAKRYPSKVMSQSVFVDNAGAGTKQFIETDGRIDVTVAGMVMDTTPSVARLEV